MKYAYNNYSHFKDKDDKFIHVVCARQTTVSDARICPFDVC